MNIWRQESQVFHEVGWRAYACRNNPFPIIIPCHRVVSKTGIGGYAGHTSGPILAIKYALLQHEKMLTHEL